MEKDAIFIGQLPFNSRSYVVYQNNKTDMEQVQNWLDSTIPGCYVLSGKNIITFKNQQAELMFVLTWGVS